MSRGDSNFDSSGGSPVGAPVEFAGIPEEVLLGWIEGELSPSEVSALAERHPEAVPWVAAMRRDRASLTAVAGAAGVRAPADLAERVMAAMEREALLGLSQGELVNDSLPISQVPKRKTPRQIWWQQATPRLALAAGLALVVCAGAIFALRGGGGAKPQGTVGPVAINDSEPTNAAVTRTLGASGLDNADTHAKVAGAVSREEVDRSVASTGAPPAAVATAIDANRAMALANEGRLVFRARRVSPTLASRLDSPRARVSPEWRVQGALPETTVAMLAPPVVPASRTSPVRSRPDVASRFGAREGTGPSGGEREPIWMNPLRLVPAAAVGPAEPANRGSVVDVRDGAESIEAAREQLSKLLGCEVEFEESPRVISMEPLAKTPDAVLWWTQSPRKWAPRVRVPLIVEMR